MKVCRKCKLEKHIHEFSKRLTRRNGLQSECKDCMNYRTRELSKHYSNELKKKRNKQISDTLMPSYIKARAIKKGYTKEMIESDPYLIPMMRAQIRLKRKLKK